MNRPCPPVAARPTGFTLMEMMLAVTILSLVVTSVYATWSAALRGWRRGTAVAEEFQRQRIVLEALDELARSAVFFVSAPALYEVRGSEEFGLGDSVSFVTASDLLLPPSEQLMTGLRRVTIAIRQEPGSRATYLALANAPAVEDQDRIGEPVWHAISHDVVGFGVRYRNPRDGGWYERWEEPGLVPSAMEFTVAFRNPDPSAQPAIVTRAVELMTAAYALEARGQSATQQNTTNRVTRQDIDLSTGGGGDDL